jgi:uncharacterized protein (DUF983 family)
LGIETNSLIYFFESKGNLYIRTVRQTGLNSTASYIMGFKNTWLYSSLFLKCPSCKQGSLFKTPNPYNLPKVNDMHTQCPVCGQDYKIEPGFYFGATYISYALMIGSGGIIGLGLWLLGGLKFETAAYVDLGILLVMIPYIYRLSRSIWLSIFAKKWEDW